MKIAVDIDDTLSAVERFERVRGYIERYRLPFRVKDPNSNKLVELYDWSEEDAIKFVREGGIAIYTDAAARKGAKEVLQKWRSLGQKIVILTSRKNSWFQNAERVSRDWLEKRQIPYDEIVTEIPPEKKGEYCLSHGIQMMIDDDEKACLSAQKLGIKAIFAVRNYNASKAKLFRYAAGTWTQIDSVAKHIFDGKR